MLAPVMYYAIHAHPVLLCGYSLSFFFFFFPSLHAPINPPPEAEPNFPPTQCRHVTLALFLLELVVAAGSFGPAARDSDEKKKRHSL